MMVDDATLPCLACGSSADVPEALCTTAAVSGYTRIDAVRPTHDKD